MLKQIRTTGAVHLRLEMNSTQQLVPSGCCALQGEGKFSSVGVRVCVVSHVLHMFTHVCCPLLQLRR